MLSLTQASVAQLHFISSSQFTGIFSSVLILMENGLKFSSLLKYCARLHQTWLESNPKFWPNPLFD